MTQLYALISPEATVDRMASDIDPKTGTKAGWRWLPVTDVRPEYDPALQVYEGPETEVGEDAVTRTWTVRDKTLDERLNETVLTDRELRLGLIDNGIMPDTIEALIDEVEDPVERAKLRVWWDRSLTIEWGHPARVQLTGMLGLSEEQAATMWLDAPGSDE